MILRINGSDVDLTPVDVEFREAPLALNKLDDKVGFYSTTFKIPKNANNKAIFKNAGLPDNIDRLPYQKLTAQILVDNTIIYNGFAYIVRSFIDTYELAFVGTDNSWIQALGDLTLNDLDLSEANHEWNVIEIDNRLTKDWTNGVAYSMLDITENYDEVLERFASSGLLFPVPLLLPQYYVKYLLKKTFERAGLKIKGSWYDNDKLLESQVIFNGLSKGVPNDDLNTLLETDTTDLELVRDITGLAGFDVSNIFQFSITNNVARSLANPTPPLDYIGYTGGATIDYVNSKIKVRYRYYLDLQGGTAGFTLRVKTYYRFFKNTVLEQENLVGDFAQTVLILDTFTGYTDYFQFELEREDYNYLNELTNRIRSEGRINTINPLGAFSGTVSIEFSVGSFMEVTSTDYLVPTKVIDVANSLPNIKLTDFIKDVANQYLLILIAENGTIEPVPFQDLVSRTPQIFTDKLNIAEPIEAVFRFFDLGRRSLLLFNEDTEPTLFGAKVIEINDDVLEPEKELFTSEFSASANGNLASPNALIPVARVPILKFNEGIRYGLWDGDINYIVGDVVIDSNGIWEAILNNTNKDPLSNPNEWAPKKYDEAFEFNELEPRLLAFEERTNRATVYGTAFDIINASIFDTAIEDGIPTDWVALAERYYLGYIRTVNRLQVIEAVFELTFSEVIALDYTRPVYIYEPSYNLNGLYYINELLSYKPNKGKSVKLQLVRVL